MSKVILVRMELAHEQNSDEDIADTIRAIIPAMWLDSLDSWSVEVVNEDPA